MKELTKKIVAVLAVLCVAATGLAGCEGKKESSSSEGEAMTKFPLQFGEAGDGNPLTPGDPNVDLNAQDPTQPATEAEVEDTTEFAVVTDDKGEPVTEVAQVTDAEGAQVTDAQGSQVTEVVTVTTVVKKPAVTQPATTAPSYTSKTDGRYAMWLDISKDENFYFEGDFLKASFKIKDGIPNGDYTVRISPDLSDITGTVVKPASVYDGIVRINSGTIEDRDVSAESGLIFYGDNVACKQGDTIDYYFYVKNNSGLAAFCIWFYFDSNAMEFLGASASGEFDEIARNTDIGAGKYNSELDN